MSRTVHCQFLDREAEGLERPPLPGETGQRIYDHISKEAWQQWMARQTMLINEKRLSPINPGDRDYLEQQCLAFLFGEGEAEQPEGYVPPEA